MADVKLGLKVPALNDKAERFAFVDKGLTMAKVGNEVTPVKVTVLSFIVPADGATGVEVRAAQVVPLLYQRFIFAVGSQLVFASPPPVVVPL